MLDTDKVVVTASYLDKTDPMPVLIIDVPNSDCISTETSFEVRK